MTRDDIIEAVIEREGGARLHNVPGDPGGPTRYGIAQAFHPEVDVTTLTLDDAIEIYVDEYWNQVQGDRVHALDANLAEIVFDMAVNLGARRATRITQAAAETTVDGIFGDQTLGAVAALDAELLALRITLLRIGYYADRVMRDRVKRKFLLGWIRRSLDAAG